MTAPTKPKSAKAEKLQPLRDAADEYVTAVSTSCARCGGEAPKNGAWLLPSPLEAVCAGCYLWADDSHVEPLIARALARTDKPMKAHQPAGTRFLARRRYALLADHMGLGKGYTTSTAIPPGSPVVVLAPKSMAREWYDELAMWRPDLYSHRAAGRASSWPGPNTVVSTNYESLPRGEPAPGTVLILDEPHEKVKNPGVALTLKIRALARKIVAALGGRCWLLTGTPLVNSPKDLRELMDVVLLAHAAFGSKRVYRDMFGVAMEKRKGQKRLVPDAASLAMIRERLSMVTIRRTRATLADTVPPKRVEVVPVELSPEDAKVIHGHVCRLVAARRTQEEVKAGKIPDPRAKGITKEQKAHRKSVWQAHFDLILANLTDPDESEITAAVDMALEHRSEMPMFEELAKVRSALATAKIRAAVELADKLEGRGEPPVFFCCHRMPIDALGRREGWRVITGGESAAKRKETKDAFQRGELRGLGVTIKAGGAGLTLTRSAHEVFVDRFYTSVANEQAEGRLDRIGQLRSVTVWRLLANHAVDRRVEQICNEKAELIEGLFGEPITDGDERWWKTRRQG